MSMRDAVISFPMLGENFRINPPASISIGGFQIYFYGIIIAFGLLLAVLYASKTSTRFGMTMEQVYDYLIWAVISAVVCARLYYCLTYTNNAGIHTYLEDPLSILRIRDGGLAIYGGVIGAILALCVIASLRHEKVWKALDIMALGLLIGQCVGRWGNFFNREAYGYETDVFCRMGLTIYGSTFYVHPTFLYESLWNLLGFLVLHFHSKTRRLYQGQYFLLYLMWYGFGRMFIEGLRSDSLWLIPGVIRISQLIAAVTFTLALVVYLANRSRLELGYRPLLGALDSDDAAPRPKSSVPQAEQAASGTGSGGLSWLNTAEKSTAPGETAEQPAQEKPSESGKAVSTDWHNLQ